MISATTYILFIAPCLMGLGGLMIYVITDRLTRSDHPRTPAE